MRPWGPFQFGLAENKIRQLVRVPAISEILIDTDEPQIAKLLDFLGKEGLPLNRIRLEERDPQLAQTLTTTDDLIQYLGGKVKTGHTLWTHVTSPFVDEVLYAEAISEYENLLTQKIFDSLMAVTPLKEFIWDAQGPVNYDYNREKWPRTQTLPDWYFINSAIFLAPTAFLQNEGNRVGSNPWLYIMDKIKSLDVDTLEDFHLTEALAKQDVHSR